MNYEDFKEQFTDDVMDRLFEQGIEVKIEMREVNKLNESYEAVTVTPEGTNVGVNVNIDNFYEATANPTTKCLIRQSTLSQRESTKDHPLISMP